MNTRLATLLYIRIIVSESEEVKAGLKLAEFCMEGSGSKVLFCQ
jgi:hypothetical protein